VKTDLIPLPTLRRFTLSFLACALTIPAVTFAQSTSPAANPSTNPSNGNAAANPSVRLGSSAAESLRGRTVEGVRVEGNSQVSAAVIMNLIRTREGDSFDPATVGEDYQRVYGLKKFSNVEARVEPTQAGVLVIFVVTEQRQITSIVFRGNSVVDNLSIQSVVDIKPGESIDRFRISLARQAIQALYKSKNYAFSHVDIDESKLTSTGELEFRIVEGPNVRVRKVNFVGNRSYTDDRLKDAIQTRHWIWIFRPGTFDPELVEDDVASVRRFYEQHGFFDARVGRKLIWSADYSDVQVQFVINEGTRYTVNRVLFQGNSTLSETDLRANLKLVEGRPFDNDVLQRDVREVVRAYSPFGFIYQPQSTDPNYLRLGSGETPVKLIFQRDASKVDLIYDISEGKPFRVGRILVRGNTKTQDKVVLRELRTAPGQLYNSGELRDAEDRLKASPFYSRVSITPVGDDPDSRDILIQAEDRDARTANFSVGGGINSNGGVGANITYEQKNFDITNWPHHFEDVFNGQAFIGAGQNFRISLEPGTTQSNASIRFSEPWIFDQPYSFTGEAYLRNRIRENYDDRRLGGRISLGKRFNYVYSAAVTFRGEAIDIGGINDKPIRAQEILDAEGSTTLTSIGLQVKRDTTNRGILPSQGTTTTLNFESVGAIGGDYTYQKAGLAFDYYKLITEDLLDRKTVFEFHSDAGYIFSGDSPFFERYYGGGIGSIRGFAFRGVSPRSGPDDDRVGGDFFVTGTAQVSFPVSGDSLRMVVFTDVGTVETDFEIGTIRASVGAGIRLTLPVLGQVPIAIDFAYPVHKDSEDDTQFISFSLGINQ